MTLFDNLLVVGILLALFLMAYTAYRQQSLLDTVREIKAMFEERIDDAREAAMVYR